MKHRPILLPTDKPSNFFINHKQDDKLGNSSFELVNTENNSNQHLCIVNDEDSKDGDWVTDNKRIAQVNVLTIDDRNKHKYKKIVASTDRSLGVNFIDEQECVKLVDYYNEHGNMPESLELEKEYRKLNLDAYLDIKLKENGSIILHIVEQKNKTVPLIFTASKKGWDSDIEKGAMEYVGSKFTLPERTYTKEEVIDEYRKAQEAAMEWLKTNMK